MMKLPVDKNTVLEMINQKPTDTLAFGRTILANERNFLAFLRTAFALLGGGIGIIGFVDRPIIFPFGWFAIAYFRDSA